MSANIQRCEAIMARTPPPLPVQAAAPIISAVSQLHAVSVPELLGPARARQVAYARFVAVALIRRRLGYSTPRIGRLLRRDHSTIVYALRRAAALERDDPDFAAAMARAASTLDSKERD